MMDLVGVIRAAPGSTPIAYEAWCTLAQSRPELFAGQPRTVPNPFKKEELMTIRPKPDAVRVVVAGKEVGSMHWAMDGRPEIIIWGEAAIVAPLAQELASSLGAQFEYTD
jgi:hypothetical protein